MKTMSDKQLLQAVFDEVGTIKEDLTEAKILLNAKIDSLHEEINEKLDTSSEELNDKLDKILEVVSEKFASQHQRITRIEQQLGLPALN